MTELQFTQENERYVSNAITATEVTVHLKFAQPSSLIVERTADESHGWAPVASRSQFGDGLFEESIVGIPEGVKVRINASSMPTLAQCLIVE